MIVVGQGDITVWRGANAPPVIWELLRTDIPDDQAAVSDDIFDLTGSVVWLTVFLADEQLIALNTDDDATLTFDITTGRVSWSPTLDESRLVPRGRKADYELERRMAGAQEPLAAGFVIALGGHNLD